MITFELETTEFNRRVNSFLRRTNIPAGKAIKKIGFDLLSHILRPEPYNRHPVKTGRARAGWYASTSGLGKQFNFESGVREESRVSEGKTKGSFNDATKSKLNPYIEMINGVDYIVWLEYGSSEQAPAGMVRVSMRKMRGALPKELDKELIKEFKKFKF